MQIVTAAISEGQRHHGRLALNVNEAGVVAGVGRDGIYAAIRAKRLEARKFGRRTVILCDDLEVFLKSLPVLELAQREAA